MSDQTVSEDCRRVLQTLYELQVTGRERRQPTMSNGKPTGNTRNVARFIRELLAKNEHWNGLPGHESATDVYVSRFGLFTCDWIPEPLLDAEFCDLDRSPGVWNPKKGLREARAHGLVDEQNMHEFPIVEYDRPDGAVVSCKVEYKRPFQVCGVKFSGVSFYFSVNGKVVAGGTLGQWTPKEFRVNRNGCELLKALETGLLIEAAVVGRGATIDRAGDHPALNDREREVLEVHGRHVTRRLTAVDLSTLKDCRVSQDKECIRKIQRHLAILNLLKDHGRRNGFSITSQGRAYLEVDKPVSA